MLRWCCDVARTLEETKPMMPVAITGFGVVSPLGCSVEEMTQRFLAGVDVGSLPGVAEGGVVVPEIPVRVFSDETRSRIGRVDRLSRMFLSASHLAMQSAGLVVADVGAERMGLSFGTGLGCLLTNEEYNRKIVEQGLAMASPRLFAYTVSSAAAGEVSIALGIKGPNVTAHMGFAAGLGAMGYGFDLIQMGKADVVLAGGADAIGPALLEALRDMRLLKTADCARPFVDFTPGIWPAEAAVVAVLERADRARERGAAGWGSVRGYAAGFEPTLASANGETTGVVATLRRALRLSELALQDVTLIVASAHGTPTDQVERSALAEVFAGACPIVLAPKASMGDSFGASGPLGLALACGCLREPFPATRLPAIDLSGSRIDAATVENGLRCGDIVMVNSLCYSGNVVSLLFDRKVP
jgi:3-oxoacyl-[acyl-carrier-protein] synthase II